MSDASPFESPSRRPADADLSVQIAQTVERGYGQRVTCRRISGSNYRCNWWSPKSGSSYDNPRMQGLLVTTHVVVKSRFLTVTRTENGLAISEASRSRS
jgi:hypothetical protein